MTRGNDNYALYLIVFLSVSLLSKIFVFTSLNVTNILGQFFSGETEMESPNKLGLCAPCRKRSVFLSQLPRVGYIILFFFFFTDGASLVQHLAALTTFKLPYGLTRVTVFEKSDGMLILLESCRIEILESNCQASNIDRELVYTDGGMQKGEGAGVSARRISCFQAVQTQYATSSAAAAFGAPESLGLSWSPRNH